MIDKNTESDLINSLTVIGGRRQIIAIELCKDEPNRDILKKSFKAMEEAEGRMERIIREQAE